MYRLRRRKRNDKLKLVSEAMQEVDKEIAERKAELDKIPPKPYIPFRPLNIEAKLSCLHDKFNN